VTTQNTWRNRIVDHGEVDPASLEPNLHNWRRHPADQRRALEGALAEIGWIQAVVVNRRTGRLVDGHLRVLAAIDAGEPVIPVTWVELTDDEERIALATFDAIASLATRDDSALADLLALITADDEDLNTFLGGLGGRTSFDDDGFDDPVVPEAGTREPPAPAAAAAAGDPPALSRQLVFNCDETQRDVILQAVMGLGRDLDVSPAEALYMICRRYLDLESGLVK